MDKRWPRDISRLINMCLLIGAPHKRPSFKEILGVLETIEDSGPPLPAAYTDAADTESLVHSDQLRGERTGDDWCGEGVEAGELVSAIVRGNGKVVRAMIEANSALVNVYVMTIFLLRSFIRLVCFFAIVWMYGATAGMCAY